MDEAFLTNPDNEFFKLDDYDKRLFFEILENHAKIIDIWIKDICEDYARKGIPMNPRKFLQEVQRFKTFVEIEQSELNNSIENVKDSLGKPIGNKNEVNKTES